jgi:hypothetical protein
LFLQRDGFIYFADEHFSQRDGFIFLTDESVFLGEDAHRNELIDYIGSRDSLLTNTRAFQKIGHARFAKGQDDFADGQVSFTEGQDYFARGQVNFVDGQVISINGQLLFVTGRV